VDAFAGLLLPGAFVVALVLGLVIRRGHPWLVVFGGIVAFGLWLVGAEDGFFDGLEGGSGLAGFVLALVFLAWAAGVGAAYLVRRIPPGSV
jgi:hypothetical protein